MAKAPKKSTKDLNLYTLVVGPKQKTVKTGLLFGILGIIAVGVLGGGYGGLRVYVYTQQNAQKEWEEKAQDEELLKKIANANEVAADIAILRTAGTAYTAVRTEIDSKQSYCDDFSYDLIEQLLTCETFVLAGQETEIAVITDFSYDNTALQLSVVSAESRYASYFIQNLQKLGIFQTVSYTGYALSDETYSYTVTATFEEHVYETEESEEAVS